MKKRKTKKAGKFKFRYLGLILGAFVYCLWRRESRPAKDADESDLEFDGFDGFDDYY